METAAALPQKPDANALAVERTDWALARTFMAADRTLMAWVRTAMSMIGFGFTLYKLLGTSTSRNPRDCRRSTGREISVSRSSVSDCCLS